MKLVFDTGAAFVSLSESMANYMIDNDYLSLDDIYDKATMRQADGSAVSVLKVHLAKVSIGGCELNNVDAVITPNQDAPLLLGQSAIQKLGRITIQGNSIIINKEEANYVGDDQNIAFLGLKQGTPYSECYDFLNTKYGNKDIYTTLTNNVIPGLDVDSVYFVNHLFETLSLYFDNDKLITVELVRHFPRNQLSSAIRLKKELYKIFSRKYKAIKTHKQPNTNFIWYYLGHEEKDDIELFPITIYLTEAKSTTQSHGDKPVLRRSYDVGLKYWPLALKHLEELYPKQDEY